ncbi:MAG TPA: hypothetical protein VFX53_05115 [Pedococcus sp.]|nr:hypothetical protein [Pedococcus sp.]
MAGKEYEIDDVTVTAIQRSERLSTDGNPSFIITTDKGTFRTQTDAAIGYAMGNYANRNLPDCILDQTVTLQCTGTGRVYGIKKDGKILT